MFVCGNDKPPIYCHYQMRGTIDTFMVTITIFITAIIKIIFITIVVNMMIIINHGSTASFTAIT